MEAQPNESVEKLATGIPGFDYIANGGLPKGRTALLAGSAGSAKTVFSVQFLVEGIKQSEEGGVLVTFEESADDIRANMRGFGWDIARWEAAGLWAFVDASPQPGDDEIIAGQYDLGALLARIEFTVQTVRATRVSMDSLGVIFSRFNSHTLIRDEIFRIVMGLKHMGVTALMTCERNDEYGAISRYGIEEFVSDNVIVLRNVLEAEKRRRTIEILKFRGTSHHKGEFPFTVQQKEGIQVIPLSTIALSQEPLDGRITSGNADLDQMCGGGFFRDSVVLVSGATGTGKTLLATEFIHGGFRSAQRCLLFAYEESQAQLFRNAAGWGRDLRHLVDDGYLTVRCEYPEAANLEDHFITIKENIETLKPERIAIDGLSALRCGATPKGFREFVISLTLFIKAQHLTGLFTTTTPTLFGDTSVTEAHFPAITDTIIMLQYVELFGKIRRGITVLKMRGSQHGKEIREFEITSAGMRIGAPMQVLTGVMAGTPVVQENGYLRDLPSPARYIVETISRQGPRTLHQLQQETGLTQARLEEELGILQQQGLVLAISRDDEVYYRTAI